MRTQFDIETLPEVLNHIIPADYAQWLSVCMGCHNEFGESALSYVDSWSKSLPGYDEDALRTKWKGFKKGGGIRFGTVLAMAKDGGWEFHQKEDSYNNFSEDDHIAWKKRHQEEYQQAQKAKEEMSKVKIDFNQDDHKVEQEILLKAINDRWNAATLADVNHKYLKTKQIQPYGLKQEGKNLLVPMFDSKGKIVNVQSISEEGTKIFTKGAQVEGAYCVIGEIKLNTRIIRFVEGLATGATVFEVTGQPVVVTFNCGNMPKVALIIKKLYPASSLVFCADNDYTTGGVGIKKAKEAVKVCGKGSITYPRFTDEQIQDFQAKGIQPTDFNDLKVKCGYTSEQIKEVIETYEIDYFSPLPNVNERGKPLETLDNLDEILKRLNYQVSYNCITKDVEFNLAGKMEYSIANKSNAGEAKIKSECRKFNYPVGSIHEYLIEVSDRNRINPALEWVTSQDWDGVDRLQAFFDTIQVKPENEIKLKDGRTLKEAYMYRWLLNAVAVLVNPQGKPVQGMLVFQGAQGIGKTSWVKSLVPEDLNAVKEGLFIIEGSKDCIKRAISCWIGELAEYDGTLKKSDMTTLKAFITSQSDEIRLPYLKSASTFPRQTVFVATTNEEEIVNDHTGARRQWIIPVDKCNPKHNLDMQQVFAQALFELESGASTELSPEEQKEQEKSNKNFEVTTTVSEIIPQFFDFNVEKQYKLLAVQVLEILIDKTQNVGLKLDDTNKKKVAHWLKSHTSSKPSNCGTVYKCPEPRGGWGQFVSFNAKPW